MTTQDPTTYNRIAKAIDYIQSNYQLQPSLDEIAEQVHLSPFHFQRLFTEWAGVSPKKFLQYISLSHAKSVLQQNASLMDAVEAAGLSGSGRLHDLFINIEGMTPGEYKNGGQNLAIQYTVENSPFGEVL
jgi:AraC family transcriptional regulator of adaptative response/methylated-DNA-[protein]-cysteine methyltransferase